jgi:hypothetical protein
MKKLMMSVVAAIFAVTLVIPAYAADNLELSGEFRVRGWDRTNVDMVDNVDQSYFDQRLRISSKINISDESHIMVRTDFGEGVWGRDFGPGTIARPDEVAELQFDRMYYYLNQGFWELTLGEQYFGVGILETVDANPVGIKLRLNFDAVQPSFLFAKIDENASLSDDGAFDDINLYALNLSLALGENFDSNVFGALADDGATDGQAWVIGAHAQGKLGTIGLTGEIAHLGGDNGANIDLEGTQFYLMAQVPVNEMVTFGGEILYAFGNNDPTELQLSSLADFGAFTPMSSNTPNPGDFQLSDAGVFTPFDPSGDGAGVQAVTLFAQMTASDVWSMGAKLGYFQPEETKATIWDDALAFNAWIAYKVTANATASLTFAEFMLDVDSGVIAGEGDERTIIAKYAINF